MFSRWTDSGDCGVNGPRWQAPYGAGRWRPGLSVDLDASLIGRVRRGEIHFARLVEVLSTRGYIIDTRTEQGVGIGRTAIDQTRHENFDALFNALPNASTRIEAPPVCVADRSGRKSPRPSLGAWTRQHLLLQATTEETSRPSRECAEADEELPMKLGVRLQACTHVAG